jgi:hypothetical protein
VDEGELLLRPDDEEFCVEPAVEPVAPYVELEEVDGEVDAELYDVLLFVLLLIFVFCVALFIDAEPLRLPEPLVLPVAP